MLTLFKKRPKMSDVDYFRQLSESMPMDQSGPIFEKTEEPKRPNIEFLQKELESIHQLYQGANLPAEVQAYKDAVALCESKIEQAQLPGRKIHLKSLLAMRKGGRPRWALANPIRPLSENNGSISDLDGSAKIEGSSYGDIVKIDVPQKNKNSNYYKIN